MATTIASIHSAIKRQGKLKASRSTYLQRNISLFGSKRLIPASKTIAARMTKAGGTEPKSGIAVVGEAPNGFGKQVMWHPDDAGLAVVVFLNSGDSMGVMISGVKATDTIDFVSATGIASFSETTKNKGVGAIIGIVAAGATLTASAFGMPGLAPLIGAAEKFAASQFEEKKVKTKRRDPFGEDPGSGHKARQEGGVIVSMPSARQIFYSGNDDHQERWIQKPGTRDYAHLPDHVKGTGAFFLQSRRSNKNKSDSDGDIIIAPWDHDFEDNFGFYRLNILLKRGSGELPDVD